MWKWLERLNAETGLTNETMHESLKGYDWMLACAVSAYQRSNGMTEGFEWWWRMSADNWTRSAQEAIPNLSASRLKRYLLWFAEMNQHKTMRQVAAESAASVGKSAPVVLGPGESIKVEIAIQIETPDV